MLDLESMTELLLSPSTGDIGLIFLDVLCLKVIFTFVQSILVLFKLVSIQRLAAQKQ